MPNLMSYLSFIHAIVHDNKKQNESGHGKYEDDLI